MRLLHFRLRDYIMRGPDRIIPPNRTIGLKWMKELLRESPDIREDVIANLRTQILRNMYEVEAELVAEKIMQNALYIL